VAVASEATVVADTSMTSSPMGKEVTTFEDLGVPSEMAGVLASEGITVPTPIQLKAIPDALAGTDVCGRAETGSGKTYAFGLPLLARIGDVAAEDPRGLILVPTRELASQVTEALEPLASVYGLRIVAVYGGTSMREQISDVKQGADILVATPGRLLDLNRRGVARLDDVKIVVIDEADQMADMGFLPQVHDVLRAIPRGHQTMLFSATLDGQVRTLVREYMKDPVTHTVESDSEIVDTQSHRFIAVHHMDKARVAAAIINSASRSLVFVQTKRGADRVAKALADEGVNVAKTHGDLRQDQREKSLDRFAGGRVQALVATNVAARGLHIDDVDVVIHYDPPDDFKTFLHRSGRTARAGEEGLVVTLVEWDQIIDVEGLQRSAGLNTEIVKMYSNDPRLADLASFEPDTVQFRKKTVADFSRRAGRRR
jgi:superfamily II DNA/RNA helicase